MNYSQIPNYPSDPYGTQRLDDLERPAPTEYYGIATQPQRQNSPPAGGSASPGCPTEDSSLIAEKSHGKFLVVKQDDSVYSAILFLPAISRLKTGKETNRPARLALLLVLLNAVLQIGVVQVISIYDYSYRRSVTQQLLLPSDVADYGDHALSEQDRKFTKASQRSQDDMRKSVLLPHEKKELEAAQNLSPLCEHEGGKLSCMPQSVKALYEWESFDTDGDGVWTAQEARADAANVRKKLHGVSPESIFNNIINGLRASKFFEEDRGRNRTLYLTADVDYERAIPKAYFNYWMGDAMMCTFFDSSSCEAAARDGVFEEALRPGRISADAKGIYDLDSAIQYCYRMLQKGGGCETLLPTDFKSNREQRWGRCGKRHLTEGGKYTSPFDPSQSVHVLNASYSSVDSYTRATSRLFLFFLSLIIMLWLLALIDEWRELIKFCEFLIVFPGIVPGTQGGDVTEKAGEPDPVYRITGLSRKHRAVLWGVFIMRLVVIGVLTQFGTKFLLVETSYLDLVLNSLALTFILTIDSMLFTLVEKDVANEMLECKKLGFTTRLPTEGILGYCLKKECWGLFLVPILSVCIVLYFNARDKEPMLTALSCACNQEGDTCLDSMAYQQEWWSTYWNRVLPSAIHQIEALRFAAMAGNSSSL